MTDAIEIIALIAVVGIVTQLGPICALLAAPRS